MAPPHRQLGRMVLVRTVMAPAMECLMAAGVIRGFAEALVLVEASVVVAVVDVALNSTDLVVHELSITGSFLGNQSTMREMLMFAENHGIAPEIELMPMSRVNEAILRVRENKARYRIVLVNDTLDA